MDTFVGNFGNYYENFQVQGREPTTFFFDFLDDVHKQYENADTTEYRTLIRQFNKIKQVFVQKLGANLNNPMIKTLFAELQSQLDKAKIVLGDDEDQ